MVKTADLRLGWNYPALSAAVIKATPGSADTPNSGGSVMLRLVGLLAGLVIAVTIGGCRGVVVAPRPSEPVVVREAGPPPHAPAHGYRHKHRGGAELRFDSDLGVYIVVGHPDIYFHDGWFVRIHSGIWQVSTTLAGPWKPKAAEWVPPGLRAKQHAKKSKGRGRGAAKAAWE